MDAVDTAGLRVADADHVQAASVPTPIPTSGATSSATSIPAHPAKPHPPSQRWERSYLYRLIAVDLTVAALAGGIAYVVRFPVQGWNNPLYMVLSLLLPLAWVLALSFTQAYEARYLYVGTDEYRRVLVAAVALTASIAFVSYAVHLSLARGYVGVALSLLTLGGLCGRYALRRWLHRNRHHKGRFMKRIVVVGYERAVTSLCRQLSRERYHGVQVVGVCLPPHGPRPERLDGTGFDVEVFGTFNDVVAAVELSGADAVAVLTCPELDAEVLRGLAWQLEKTRTELFVAPALIDVAGPRTTIRPIDGLPLLHVEHPELAGTRRVVKTMFDLALAGLALVILSPALVAVAVAVRCTSPGPALFRQTRVGREGTTFPMYKFRTMYVGSEERLADVLALNEQDGVLFKMRRDPRVTPLGRWLRRYSIDELPQLINVLRGEMSLVGPRPPLPTEVELYADHVRRRLVVKPGLTGLWQVSGRSDLPWEEAVRLDLRYVENWSLALDVVILARTITAVFRPSGAY